MLGPDYFDPRQIPIIDARLSEQEEPQVKAGKPPKAKPAEIPAAEIELTEQVAEQLRGSVGADAFKAEANVITVQPERIVDVCRALRDELGYDLLSNLSSVDYPERFEVVYRGSFGYFSPR